LNRRIVLPLVALCLSGLSCGDDDKTTTPPTETRVDLQALSLRWEPTNVQAGDAVTVLLTIRNAGESYTPLSDAHLRDERTGASITMLVAALSPGASVDLRWSLGPLEAGRHRITACADPDGALNESDEQNNCLTDSLEVAPALHLTSVTRQLASDLPSVTRAK
jgi:subtilase family serine protease